MDLCLDKDEDQINEQMQELLSLWNSRNTNVIVRPELKESNPASTVFHIESDEDILFLPAPRRYHPAVWKVWARRLASMVMESVE